MVITTIENQLIELGHNPVFFTREIGELRRLLSPGESISGFIDGWVEQLKSEGSAYITNHRIVFLAFDEQNRSIAEDIPWGDICKVSSDITEALSEFAFITPYRSICITNIESRYSSKAFLATIEQQFPHIQRTHKFNSEFQDSGMLH